MTEAVANSKKDIAAVYPADYSPPGRGVRLLLIARFEKET
jgi:hypothetical protein